MTALAGQLLVATPRLTDPNFRRAVVFLLNHDDEGALGVVLNRPSPVAVAEVLPVWERVVSSPPSLFGGGPVEEDAALGVAVVMGKGPERGFQRLWQAVGLVDLDDDPHQLVSDLVGMRIFSGYAGWGAGQLESEVAEGSWYVLDSAPLDLITPDPAGLWSTVLRRQHGEVAYAATMPDDPSMN